jgi:hypothetical protein
MLPMQIAMRRAAIVVLGLLIVFLVIPVRSGVGAAVSAGVIAVVVLASIALAWKFLRDRTEGKDKSPLPWAVALGVAAVTAAPQSALHHWKNVGSGIFGGIVGWLLIAIYLRFVILLLDYLRGRFAKSPA